MNNIFEQEAILDGFFKKFVASTPSDANFIKSIVNKNITIKDTDILGDVYIGKFFSLLGGAVRIYYDFKHKGTGQSTPNSIVFNIKNLDTNEVQTFYTNTNGGNNVVNLLPRTKYEITVNVGSGTTFAQVYLSQFDLCFDVETKPEKYIISEQAEG